MVSVSSTGEIEWGEELGLRDGWGGGGGGGSERGEMESGAGAPREMRWRGEQGPREIVRSLMRI